MIKLIEIGRLWPHPNNPRKDLGDLTELAESIKANGILQNLTVVPWFSEITGVGCDDPMEQEVMGYRVIIGHRRLAAAALAGLKEVMCSVVEMDKKTQIATMLLENMQRSDLTIIEQAEGFQMMIDLGESVSNISQQTGFSQTTVRRRVKLLELDKDKFYESAMRGGTLMDYMELDKIKSVELKNKVLEDIGTNNFNWALKDALRQEETEENKATLIKLLETFAIQVTDDDGMEFVERIYFYNGANDFEKPEDAGEEKYCFIDKGAYIDLLQEKEEEHEEAETESEEKDKRTLEEFQEAEKRSAFKEVSKKAFQLRLEFVKDYTGNKKHATAIMEFTTRTILLDRTYFDMDQFLELMNIDLEEDEEFSFEKIADDFLKSPESIMLVTVYCQLQDSEQSSYWDWNYSYKKDEELDLIYEFLQKLGYEMSDEEKALQNGTHKLFS
jgi:ParB family transcriptional regulator, chromosome partitioning protein